MTRVVLAALLGYCALSGCPAPDETAARLRRERVALSAELLRVEALAVDLERRVAAMERTCAGLRVGLGLPAAGANL